MSRLSMFANNTNDTMITFNARLKSRTNTLSECKQPDGAVNLKPAKKIINKAAHDLNDLTTDLEKELHNFSFGAKSTIDAFQGALQVVGDFDRPTEEEKSRLLEQVNSLISALSSSSQGMAAFRNSIRCMPRTTLEFNRARKSARRLLDTMIEEFDKNISLFSQLIDPIRRL